ncbi:M14-type cytosolic carboxypeptidase [Planctomicrobium sp. SH664]|uniref:M14-type cytosolic carboxypeptidase n=1 Tax=Planctomicrobium sp. SH664 TaxID=3448125 RepID=UPI003F5C6AC7
MHHSSGTVRQLSKRATCLSLGVMVSVLILSLPGALAAEPTSPLAVSCDFPGGSVRVEGIDQTSRTLQVSPAGQKERGWTCWWYFQVQGVVPGETLTLDLGGTVWATPNQCFFSTDQLQWKQTDVGERKPETGRIVYRQRIDAPVAWFAWGPPFVPDDAARLVNETAARHPWAEAFELCVTRGNRPTPALRISEPGPSDHPRKGVWIQARQHAFEAGSSWVCQGFVEWLVSDDPRARQLRQSTDIVIVPIMDIDNVFLGAGGKDEVPQDHNRDWSDHPHWRGVEAAQQEILKMNAEGRFDLFVDLHNPGAGSRNPYFYVCPQADLSEPGRDSLSRFLKAARSEMVEPLAFVGKAAESGGSVGKGKSKGEISKNWVSRVCRPHVVAVTLETAWNTPHSNLPGYLHVGAGLGKAVATFLEPE